MTTINFKRGSTFVIYCQRQDSTGAAVNLTGVTLTSQIRGLGYSFALTTAITDATNGKFTVSATPADNIAWPVATLYFDVLFDDGTYALLSDTINVAVSDRQTQSVTSTSTGLPGASGNPLVFKDTPQTTGTISAGETVQTASNFYTYAAHYLGPLTADPTTQPDGSALETGDLYWSTAAKELKTYNGTNWQVNYTPSPSTISDITYTGTLTGGTGAVNIGSGQLYKDASGNVGIGISSPGAHLHVLSGATATAALRVESAVGSATLDDIKVIRSGGSGGSGVAQNAWIQLNNSTDANGAGWQTYDGGSIFWGYSSGWHEHMRTDSSGRLLVGKTSASGSGVIQANGPISTRGYTVATLPSGAAGDRAYVTDATSPTFLGALTGGGSTVTPVFHNGSAWVAG
jgi:hypothetical protein